MSGSRLPEVVLIFDFCENILSASGNNAPALATVSSTYTSISGDAAGLFGLFRLIDGLEKLPPDLSGAGVRVVAENLCKRLREVLRDEHLVRSFADYKVISKASYEFVIETISIFDEMKFDPVALVGENLHIQEEISKLQGRIYNSAEISDASKTVLAAQLELLRRSLERFSTVGVGPFRETVFSIFGKVVIQLEGDAGSNADAKRKVIDDFLRVCNLIQIGGGLVKLGGPIVAGLLTGPVSL